MNKLLLLLAITYLSSCTNETEPHNTERTKVIEETINTIKRKIDTVYIEKVEVDDFPDAEFYFNESLPDWLIESNILEESLLTDKFEFSSRLNPFYLEADFNGDGNNDVAIPISEIDTEKDSFAIIHGTINTIYIIGAGNKVKNALSDDLSYIDIWKVNRKKTNKPGLEENTGTGDKGELIIETPSLNIEKSEIGGGLMYWTGSEYAYFHQTC